MPNARRPSAIPGPGPPGGLPAPAGPIPLGGPRQRAVLAALIVHAGALVLPEQLIDAVWGEEPPDSARGIIQTYVSHLRTRLAQVGSRDHGGYRLRPRTEGTWMPTGSKSQSVGAMQPLLVDPAASFRPRDDSLGLWRGPRWPAWPITPG